MQSELQKAETSKSCSAKGKQNFIKLLLSVILLFIGGSIYILFRDSSIILFRWIDALGLTDSVNKARECCSDITLSEFVLYSLPDGLWLISYLLIVDVVIPRASKYSYIFWLSLLPAYAIGNELLQATHLVKGCFDVFDLLCYMLAMLIFFIIRKLLS